MGARWVHGPEVRISLSRSIQIYPDLSRSIQLTVVYPRYNWIHMLHGAGICTNICQNKSPSHVGKYTIHGAYRVCFVVKVIPSDSKAVSMGQPVGIFTPVIAERVEVVSVITMLCTITQSQVGQPKN